MYTVAHPVLGAGNLNTVQHLSTLINIRVDAHCCLDDVRINLALFISALLRLCHGVSRNRLTPSSCRCATRVRGIRCHAPSSISDNNQLISQTFIIFTSIQYVLHFIRARFHNFFWIPYSFFFRINTCFFGGHQTAAGPCRLFSLYLSYTVLICLHQRSS